jgi:carboxylesterase type B
LLNSVGEYSKLLAELLNCPTFPTKKLVDCLRNRDPIEIARFSRQNLTIIDIFPIAFGPRIDLERESPFVPAHPQQLIENKQFNHVPFITGMNENEGSFLLSGMLIKNGIGMQKFKNDPVKFMRYILGLEYDENGADIARHVIDHVFDKKKPLDEQPKSFEKLFSDSTMFHCIDKSVKLFSKYNEQPTFTYFYTHRGQNSFPELIGDGTSSYNDFGVSHFDEIFMLFNNQIWPPLSSPEDVKVSNIFIDYWTSFANNGTPQSGLAPQWLPTKEGKTRYLKLNENPALKNEALPFSERLPFWNYVSQLAAGKDQQPSTSDVNSGGQVIYYFRWIWF